MNTQTPKSLGELIRNHITATTPPARDLEAEATTFCLRWQELVGVPTTKRDIEKMMRRAISVLGVSSHKDVEVVLADVRRWLSLAWLTDMDVPYNTAVARWKKACLIEDVILVDYV